MKQKIENVILGGIPEDQFAEQIWGATPFHSKDCFSPKDYFSIRELTDILRESGVIRYGATSVGKEKSDLFQPYVSSFDVSKLKELEKLHIIESLYDAKSCFDDGRGILAHRLERFLPLKHKLRIIYNYLLELTGCVREELVVAAFLTPPYSKTFDWHTDSDHVFTMQIEGEKKWEIKELDGRINIFQITPGDVLYIPADLPHRVVSEGSTSLSVSYVVIPKTYSQIFTTALLKKLEKDLYGELKNRIPLPFRWRKNLNSMSIDKVTATVFRKYGLEDQDFRDALIDEYASDSISYLDEAWNPNFNYADRKLELHTKLQRSSSNPINIVRRSSSDEVVIIMNGRPSLCVSSKLIMAIDYISEADTHFSCDDLPDCYTDESKIFICAKLLQAGMVDFL
ncbi:MAG: cupin domain-containing protein [Gammaproteobacteria bacterium]|nr:cupin domain-containing protein [Gammaproteobacteria bacterium]MDH5729071.1 cupin domain-containing protein [Gammaproteobacteria bacterium]